MWGGGKEERGRRGTGEIAKHILTREFQEGEFGKPLLVMGQTHEILAHNFFVDFFTPYSRGW